MTRTIPDPPFHNQRDPRDGDRVRSVVLDGDFEPLPLRCPACGNRGRLEEGGTLWLTVGIRIGSDGLPAMILSPDHAANVDCTRCDHNGPLPTFFPPGCAPTEKPTTFDGRTWPSLPERIDRLPLTDGDRAVEAAWTVAMLTP